MSAGAINRLVALVRGRSPRGACYLIESGPDQHQLFLPTRRGPLRWASASGADVRATTLEQAMQLYLVTVEPADWATAPQDLLDSFRLPPGQLPTRRLKTIRPYGVSGRVSA